MIYSCFLRQNGLYKVNRVHLYRTKNMRVRSFDRFPSTATQDSRPVPPGTGFLIGGLLSLGLWAAIAEVAFVI